VFPPVFITGPERDGRLIQQMHVDGGVNAPFIAVPERMLLWRSPHDAPAGSNIYILVNGIMESESSITRGSFPAIMRRTLSSSGRATTRIHLAANVAFAKRNGVALSLSAIPQGTPAALLNFRAESMAALFEEGRRLAAANQAWTKLAPVPEPTVKTAAEPGAKPDTDVVVESLGENW